MRAPSLALSLALCACASRYAPAPRCPSPAPAASAPSPAVTLADAPRVPVEGAPMLGPRDAAVTVVVFGDFQCPYSNRARAIVSDLRAMHPRDVRVVWRHLPLPRHADARVAAEAAAEVFAQTGDAGFWRYHDILFAHADALDRPSLERWAGMVGADVSRVRAALDEGERAAEVERDQSIAERLEVDGTPGFVVNGTVVMGAQPFSVFEALVAQALDRAHAARDPSRAYVEAVDDPLPTPARPSRRAVTRDTWARVHEVPVPPDARALGPEGAPVVMQVFSDFQCPFCARVEPTIAALRERYGDRLRVVWRDMPLSQHPRATAAAEAAREVYAQGGAAMFWRYHDLLFAHQDDEDALSDAMLQRLAREAGADPRRVAQAVSDRRHAAAVRADVAALGATGLNAGTPAFFVNGHYLGGARPEAEFRARIDGLLGDR